VRRLFRRRTDALIVGTIATVVLLALVGLTTNFYVALVLVVVWAMCSRSRPLRQAYLNGVIPSEQRATVLSFDNMIGATGGVIIQPALGRVADVNGYGTSYVVAAGIQALAIPFLVLARREKAVSDPITDEKTPTAATPGVGGPEAS
jgi:MFS family permease